MRYVEGDKTKLCANHRRTSRGGMLLCMVVLAEPLISLLVVTCLESSRGQLNVKSVRMLHCMPSAF